MTLALMVSGQDFRIGAGDVLPCYGDSCSVVHHIFFSLDWIVRLSSLMNFVAEFQYGKIEWESERASS